MIRLSDITLRNGLLWEEQFAYTGVVQEMKTTLGGTPAIFTATVQGPMPITLKSTEDQGWQTYDIVKQLNSISKVPNGSFPLIFGADSFIVSLRHYEPPVLEATPLVHRSVYSSDDLFSIVLKLVAYSA